MHLYSLVIFVKYCPRVIWRLCWLETVVFHNDILCNFFQPGVTGGTDVEWDKIHKPSGRLHQKPAVLSGIPVTKIHIFFASQTGTSKVPQLTACTSDYYPIYTIRPVWQPCWTNSHCSFNRLSNRVVQPFWQPAVYTIQPVVKPVVKRVWQPVECLYTRYNRLWNPFDNRFDNRLYHVNGA